MLRIYVDAATKGNPGESGGGIVYLTDQSRQQLHVPLGIVSNHEAEFKVLIEALKKRLPMKTINKPFFSTQIVKLLSKQLKKLC